MQSFKAFSVIQFGGCGIDRRIVCSVQRNRLRETGKKKEAGRVAYATLGRPRMPIADMFV